MPHQSEQHAQHDHLLVVSLAAGDLTAADRDRATSQIATCAECALLHDDLLAIARATAVLPAAVRPRDFQLSPEQAARLRPTGWRRFVAAFASPRFAMTRQLGVGLATLGMAGLMVSVLGSVNLGMAGSAAAPAEQQSLRSTNEFSAGGEPAASPAAALAAPSGAAPYGPAASRAAASAAASEEAPVVGAAGTSASPDSLTPLATILPDDNSRPSATSATDRGTTGVAQVPPAPTRATPAPDANRDVSADVTANEPTVSLIVVASVILLAAGIALLLARRVARKITIG